MKPGGTTGLFRRLTVQACERVLKSDVRYRFMIDIAIVVTAGVGRVLPPIERLLTVRQVAAQFGVSTATVYRQTPGASCSAPREIG